MSDGNSFSLLITYSIKGITHASIKPDNNLIKYDILVIALFINNKMKSSKLDIEWQRPQFEWDLSSLSLP